MQKPICIITSTAITHYQRDARRVLSNCIGNIGEMLKHPHHHKLPFPNKKKIVYFISWLSNSFCVCAPFISCPYSAFISFILLVSLVGALSALTKQKMKKKVVRCHRKEINPSYCHFHSFPHKVSVIKVVSICMK